MRLQSLPPLLPRTGLNDSGHESGDRYLVVKDELLGSRKHPLG